MTDRSLASYLPELTVPDRPPDEPTGISNRRTQEYEEGRYQVWYPTADSPIGVCVMATTDLRHGPTYEDAEIMHNLGSLGLRPALDYLGIQTFLGEGLVRDWPVKVAGLMHPPAAEFCERFNSLVRLECGSGRLPFGLEPYENSEDPIYSWALKARKAAKRIMLIATEPRMARHDIAHGVALYCAMSELADPLQSRAQEAHRGADPDVVGLFANRFEGTASLTGVSESLQQNRGEGWIEESWRYMLRQESREAPAVTVALDGMERRITTTPRRLAQVLK